MSGKKEECLVAHFQEPDMKPLIMNKTNCKAAAKLFGTDYIEDWIGRSFVMGVRSVSAYGDTVDAVRVLPKRPPRKAPQICTDCGQEIIGTAKGTAEQVAQASAARFGRKLCAECAAKELKKEKEGTENVGA